MSLSAKKVMVLGAAVSSRRESLLSLNKYKTILMEKIPIFLPFYRQIIRFFKI